MIRRFENKFIKLVHQFNDYCYLNGKKSILISTPHSVKQTRNNTIKPAEPQTALVALFFNERNFPCIIKTSNNNDDANFDLECPYKKELSKKFKLGSVKFLLDLHQLNPKREMDFCLGTGGNDFNNLLDYSYMVEPIKEIITDAGYSVEVNKPFGAGKPYTNSGFLARRGYPALQLEVNTRLLYNVSVKEFAQVLMTIEKILDYIEKEIH